MARCEYVRHFRAFCVYRYQSEITTAEEVCRQAGFGSRCTSATPIKHYKLKVKKTTTPAEGAVNRTTPASRSTSNIVFGARRRRLQAELAPGDVRDAGTPAEARRKELTWEVLDAEDLALSTQVGHHSAVHICCAHFLLSLCLCS
jgi:hypothetical protein